MMREKIEIHENNKLKKEQKKNTQKKQSKTNNSRCNVILITVETLELTIETQ